MKNIVVLIAKIIIGIGVIAGLVVFAEWSCGHLLDKVHLSEDVKPVIIAIFDAGAALLSYILLVRFFEERRVAELNFETLGKDAITGILTGLILQSLFILILYIAGDYDVLRVNGLRTLLPGFAGAFTAGFVAEILIRGVFFRLIEEEFGTWISVFVITILFGVLHINAPGSTILSVVATAIHAGFFISVVYVLSRSLWMVIFLHFAWDFAEPAIFGAINPGIHVDQTLLTSRINGSDLLTGAASGPQSSIQSLVICLTASILVLWVAKRKQRLIKPYWQKTA
jgi:uncharacterized protein